ncbi:MAG: hypothetical protein HOL17_01385 [Gammaproteobacteria bacterium]|jgi:hypothetical protein|nr:hypothetical protein [Candidatus Neomarinimicrobiota bacterium]MBT4607791.1 hypothetical protein [Thiotrichales bacterium]MBT5370359.1 hypothetical protein [Gammaproteobacteria bacterium]MBT7831534.1 hypothetical protein [Candidatus Neomarinimicrobiota bacterium]
MRFRIQDLVKETVRGGKKHMHLNAGKPWTEELEQKLEQKFNKGDSVKELSIIFGRTEGAIKSRLHKMGLM